MLEDDYFERKRQELDLARGDQLARVQKWLDEQFPGRARARQLHQGVLRLETDSAPVANDLRMRQVELLAACGLSETRLAIRIATR